MPGRREARAAAFLALIVTALTIAGCSGSNPRVATARSIAATSTSAVGNVSTTASPAVAPTTTTLPDVVTFPTNVTAAPTTTVAAPTATPAAPPVAAAAGFRDAIAAVTESELGASYHAGCPVGPEQLRRVTVSYWGFEHVSRTGAIVVHVDVAAAVVNVFRSLYGAGFVVRSLQPIAAFGGNDDASMAADNTSGFNCRFVVAAGPRRWSVHAYGKAIDVNPIENPYLEGGVVRPPGGAAFLRRSDMRPGMAGPGSVLNNAFARAGWLWGGRWNSSPDYQHFSATGG